MQPPPTDRGKILVIDDSWVVLEAVRSGLVATGYGVRVTTEPHAAAKMASWAELVIVDFHMPGIDGARLLPSLKKGVAGDGTCLFYLYTSDADVARKYEAFGFDGGFLRKGDERALIPQVDAAFRTIKLRKLAGTLRSGRTNTSKPPES
jgi:CheY-like chemotaxis protein